MRYLTKEWYTDMQRAHLCLCAKPDPRAAEFSEDYYQELYAAQEAEELDFFRKVAERSREDVAQHFECPPPTTDVLGNPIPEEQQAVIAELQRKIAETTRKMPPFVFDPDKVRSDFRRKHEDSVEVLRMTAPRELQTMVADLRVLALDRAAPDVCDWLKAYRAEKNAAVNTAARAEQAAFKQAFPSEPPKFYNSLDRHDEKIISFEQQDGDWLMTTKYVCIRFHDADLLKLDKQLDGQTFLYLEVYPCDKGYEIHILFYDRIPHSYAECLTDLILRCSNVTITGRSPET